MKYMDKTMGLGLLSACLCLLCAAPASAKVCFVGEENCTGGGNFDNYKDPGEDGKLCEAEGYILKEKCTGEKQVVAYCPYNGRYVMCCGKEYIYDSCTYPHIMTGKCGNKYSCSCDPNIYKYTEEQCESDNAYPAGASCTQVSSVSSGEGENLQAKTVKEILYSACLCDRGTYTQPKEKCDKTQNLCKDSSGAEYTDTCVCDKGKYKVQVADCDYGGEGKTCVEGGVTFAEDCCSCEAYPVELRDGKAVSGGENYDKATDWNPCPCPTGKNRVFITQCEKGWRPTQKGDGCERIPCADAVKLYLSEMTDKNMGVFNGKNVVTYKKLTEEEKAKLPVAEQTYAVGAEVVLPDAEVGILLDDVTIESNANATGLGASKITTLWSGLYFGKSEGRDGEGVVASCEKEDKPTGNFSGTNFPRNKSESGELTFVDVNIAFAKAVSVRRPLRLENANLTGSNVAFEKAVTLAGNEPKVVFGDEKSSYTFKSKLTADGYNFEYKALNFAVPISSVSDVAVINLPSGGEMKGGAINVYPQVDSYLKTFRGVVTIQGNESGISANVYSDAYIGVNPYNKLRAKGLKISLQGNVNWKLYGKKASQIVLGMDNQIETKEIRGQRASIMRDSDIKWKSCYAWDYQPRPIDQKWQFFPGCERKVDLACTPSEHIKDYQRDGSGEEDKVSQWTEGYFVCAINATGTSSVLTSYHNINRTGLVGTDDKNLCYINAKADDVFFRPTLSISANCSLHAEGKTKKSGKGYHTGNVDCGPLITCE